METRELWRTIGASLAAAFRDAPGFESQLTPTGWLLFTGEPIADFNWIMVDDGPDPEGQLRGFSEVLHARDLPALVILTEAVADRLERIAAALELQPAGRVPLMTYQPPADHPNPSATGRYRVELVTDAAELRAAHRLAGDAFEIPAEAFERVIPPTILATPGVAFFLAWDEAEPVSTVTTIHHGPIVGIWTMATPPARQRQGAGQAILAHALAHHRARGADLFYLLATEAGLPLYQRVGFRTLTAPTIWARGHSVQVGGH